FLSPQPRAAAAQLKLLQETKIVLKEQAQIIDPIAQRRQALHPHSESEAGIGLSIYARGLEHLRMNHSAPHHLKPPGVFEHAPALAMTVGSWYVYLSGRPSEGEIGRAGTKWQARL